MKNGKAKVLKFIAILNMISGLILGVFLGALPSGIRDISSDLMGSYSSYGFNYILMVIVWIIAFIQSAWVMGFAELIEQTYLTAQHLNQIEQQYQMNYYPQQSQQFFPRDNNS